MKMSKWRCNLWVSLLKGSPRNKVKKIPIRKIKRPVKVKRLKTPPPSLSNQVIISPSDKTPSTTPTIRPEEKPFAVKEEVAAKPDAVKRCKIFRTHLMSYVMCNHFSSVSVHNCIIQERRMHLHGGHQRYLLLLQWLLQPGRCGLRNLCKWLWCLLPV